MKPFFLIALFLHTYHAQAQVSDSIRLSNAILYYEVKGEGSPILLLSGGPGVSSQQLSRLRDSVSQKYKTILFDQRGTGQSHASLLDSTTINLKQSVDDIATLLKQLKLNKVTIVGHSWGAMLAISFAIEHPSQINQLVLISPGPLAFSDYAIQADNVYARASRSEKEFMDRLEDSMKIAPSRTLGMARAKQFLRFITYDAARTDSIFEEVRKGGSSPIMSMLIFQDLQKTNYNVKNKIGSIKFPTLVICGRQDPIGIFPGIYLKELNNNINLVWIEKSGHYPWLEQPRAFYSELLKFLK